MIRILLSLFLAASAAMSAGCTTYSVEKTTPDGSSTLAHVKSTRSFETPNLHYARTGADAEFDFSAQSVDNNTEQPGDMQ